MSIKFYLLKIYKKLQQVVKYLLVHKKYLLAHELMYLIPVKSLTEARTFHMNQSTALFRYTALSLNSLSCDITNPLVLKFIYKISIDMQSRMPSNNPTSMVILNVDNCSSFQDILSALKRNFYYHIHKIPSSYHLLRHFTFIFKSFTFSCYSLYIP